jgi:hypothetical protein
LVGCLVEFRCGFRLKPSGYREGGVDLGDGGPHGGGVLAVSVAEVFSGFLRELLGFAEVSSAIHRSSRCLVVCYWSDTAFGRPVNRWAAGIEVRVAPVPDTAARSSGRQPTKEDKK